MITLLRRLPIVRNCFNSIESDEDTYPNRLKQPTQIKISTIKKANKIIKSVFAIALIALLIFGIFIPILPTTTRNHVRLSTNNNCHNSIPVYLQPYSAQMEIKTLPDSYTPISLFPWYLDKNMYPGKISGDNGSLGEIPKGCMRMPTFEEFNKICTLYVKQAQEFHASESSINNPNSVKGMGDFIDSTFIPDLATSIKRVYFGMDKRKVTAYTEALSFIEKEILNFTHFLMMNSSTLVESIKKTNRFVTNYICDNPGELRNQISMLLNDDIKISRKGLRSIFYNEGGTLKDLKNFHSLYDKLEKYDFVDKALKYLNRDELRVLKMLGQLTCAPREINSKLNNLAVQIIELAVKVNNQEIQPIAAAAFIHQELFNTHYFMFGNGRTARIWMNVILQLGGIKAIVIPENANYAKEVIKDRKSPGSFVIYLRKTVEWNRMQAHLNLQSTISTASSSHR